MIARIPLKYIPLLKQIAAAAVPVEPATVESKLSVSLGRIRPAFAVLAVVIGICVLSLRSGINPFG